MWDSLEQLQKLNSGLIISWVVISAIFGFVSWIVQSRVSTLTGLEEAELQSKVQGTEVKAKDLEIQLQESEKLREETNKKLKEEIEKTNTKLQARKLTSDQKKKFIAFLKHAPKGNISVNTLMGNAEAYTYSKQLDEALVQAGWTTSGVSQSVFTGTLPTGVLLIIKDAATAPPRAGALQRAFEHIGIIAEGHINPAMPSDSVELLVGNKQ